MSKSSSAGSANITVTSNATWSINESLDWLSVNTNSGTGNGSFTINLTANTSSPPRSGTVTVTGGGLTRYITVNQEGQIGGECSAFTNGTEVAYRNGNPSVKVVVSINEAGCRRAVWSNGDGEVHRDWINANSSTAIGNFTLAKISQCLTFQGETCTTTGNTLEVSPSSVNKSSPAGSETISVTSNVAWSASESLDWISLSSTSGSGNGSFTINLTANTSTAPRSGSVTVTGGSITRYITVNQDGQSGGDPFVAHSRTQRYLGPMTFLYNRDPQTGGVDAQIRAMLQNTSARGANIWQPSLHWDMIEPTAGTYDIRYGHGR